MKQLFGLNLRKIRQGKGYSQEKLASLSAMEQPQISSYENGIHWPSYRVVQNLATALECEESELFRSLSVEKENEYLKKIRALEQQIKELTAGS